MDSYSYISENGTIRQIVDLIAKAKNEEQDGRIAQLESAVAESRGIPDWTARRLVWKGPGQYKQSYTFPEDGMLIVSGYGKDSSTGYIYFKVNEYWIRQQAISDEWISENVSAKKGTVVSCDITLSSKSEGLYFVPYL